jgi:hypothetical protein
MVLNLENRDKEATKKKNLVMKNPTAKKGTFIDSSSLSNNKTKARNPSTYTANFEAGKKNTLSLLLHNQTSIAKEKRNAILHEKSTRTRTRSSRSCTETLCASPAHQTDVHKTAVEAGKEKAGN